MTEQIYSDNIRKINQNKKVLEKALKVKFSFSGKIIFIEGEAEYEFTALKIIEAINLGFSVNTALLINNDEYSFQTIRIKDISKRKNLAQVRGRVIGAGRKTLNTIESLTNCYIVVHDNIIGVIGLLNETEKAIYALKRLIGGSKHASVYAYLEEQKALEKSSFN